MMFPCVKCGNTGADAGLVFLIYSTFWSFNFPLVDLSRKYVLVYTESDTTKK